MAIVNGTLDNDRLTGTRTADQFFGFAGDDTLAGGRGADAHNGGTGTDTVSYTRAAARVRVDLVDPSDNRGEASGDTYVSIERVIGSRFGDNLQGGLVDTVLFGRGGNDVLTGQFGNTRLVGGTGADTLIGLGVSTVASYLESSSGVRVYLSAPGRNTGEAAGDVFENISGLEGSRRSDILVGNSRDNALSGLAGRDQLYGGSGNDRLEGGVGGDRLYGGRGVDSAAYSEAAGAVTVDLARSANNRGDALGDRFSGIESIDGSAFNDTLRGDAGANRINGGEGNDGIAGRAGTDTLYGLDGRDRLFGEAGDDNLIGGLGADALNGGSGQDIAAYWNAGSGLTVDLGNRRANTGEARGDTYTAIEGVAGSGFSDILRGNSAANILLGREGDDALFGGDGADQLAGGLGADRLTGGSGSDAASYFFATASVTASLYDNDDNTGEAAGDTYSGIENLIGSSFADTLVGNARANRLDGRGGDDSINGGSSADALIGGAGSDTIIGGRGADSIEGGTGRDILSGGSDGDRFIFRTAPDATAFDDIVDFTAGQDVFALQRSAFGNLPGGQLDDDAFHLGAAATAASHRLIYNATTGAVSFDADGAGGASAIRFAVVDVNLGIDSGDFILI